MEEYDDNRHVIKASEHPNGNISIEFINDPQEMKRDIMNNRITNSDYTFKVRCLLYDERLIELKDCKTIVDGLIQWLQNPEIKRFKDPLKNIAEEKIGVSYCYESLVLYKHTPELFLVDSVINEDDKLSYRYFFITYDLHTPIQKQIKRFEKSKYITEQMLGDFFFDIL